MLVKSNGIVNGIIDRKYGKYGSQCNEDGVPSCSLPVEILDAPEGTKTFALILEDKDAIPVCGFSWIHWTAANITRTTLAEGESAQHPDYVQGVNSFASVVQGYAKERNSCYGGMTPPDRPHTYELHVYALDTQLELETGFYMNELYWKMQGHILAQATLTGVYEN